MSVKINFVRGDEVLTTTMSVGRTMLMLQKNLIYLRYQQYVTGHVIVAHVMYILILNGLIRLNRWTQVLWNFLCLKDQKILMSLEVVYVVKWIFMMFMKV